jgi:hypothetical protein
MEENKHMQMKIVEEYCDFLTEAIKVNFDIRDESALQQTVGLCELSINTGAALLGAMGVVTVIAEDLHWLSSFMFIISALIILCNILISIYLRSRILEANRSTADKRAEFGSAHLRKVADKINEDSLLSEDTDVFRKRFRLLKEEEKTRLDSIRAELEVSEKKDLKYLKTMKLLLSISISGIAIAVITEVLASLPLQVWFEFLCDFISNLF